MRPSRTITVCPRSTRSSSIGTTFTFSKAMTSCDAAGAAMPNAAASAASTMKPFRNMSRLLVSPSCCRAPRARSSRESRATRHTAKPRRGALALETVPQVGARKWVLHLPRFANSLLCQQKNEWHGACRKARGFTSRPSAKRSTGQRRFSADGQRLGVIVRARHLLLPGVRRACHVDGRRLFHAGGRSRAREEHGRDPDEERRALLDRVHHVHALRLRD